MSESILQSSLFYASTATPPRVMVLARLVVNGIGSRLTRGPVAAHLYHASERAVVADLSNGTDRTVRLHIECGVQYNEAPVLVIIEPRAGYDLGVPDFPEALHLLGIILADLGVKRIALGNRDSERNPELLAEALASLGTSGRMATCDFQTVSIYRQRDRILADDFAVERVATLTPADAFHWCAQKVQHVREALAGKRIKAWIWGYRGNGLVVKENSKGIRARDGNWLAAHMRDEHEATFEIPFSIGTVTSLRNAYIATTTAAQALHMVGMIFDALGASLETVGFRKNEQHPCALSRPLADSDKSGPMISASNFVAPCKLEGVA